MTEYYLERYQELASAIIVEACEDYKRGKYSEEGFYAFTHSKWFGTLLSLLGSENNSGDWIYQKMKKEKEDYIHEYKHRKHI